MPVLIRNRQRRQKADIDAVRQFSQDLLELTGCTDKELSLLLVSDAQIRVINRDYLGRDKPTNVISFAMSEGEFGGINPGLLGDIIISVETAFRDAISSGRAPLDELEYLIIHGALHLLGYDHETADERRRMEKKEAEVFSALKGYKLKR